MAVQRTVGGRTMPHKWVIAPLPEGHLELAERLRVSPLTARVLCNRGLTDFEQAQSFFEPKLSHLLPPEALPGAQAAADLVRQAIEHHHKIVIYGDYDVDGITGTAILWHCLRMAGADVDYYIPHRLEEGYGLNEQALRQVIADGAGLVITVDCGITALHEAQVARELGAKLIITDHHRPRAQLPAADVVLHPQLNDYPFPHLSGAGVALKLAWAVAQHFSSGSKVSQKFRDFLLDATSLAALGTIADVVPLLGENRILAKFGLLGLANSTNQGIVALLKAANLDGRSLHSDHVGFWLAPRLNAAGRLGHARLAVEMFTRASPEQAVEIATYLEQQNRARQTIERQITEQAREMVLRNKMDSDDCRAVVLAQTGWHAGVVGIVAARLVDEFRKPAVLVCFEPDASIVIGQGSARSIRGFALDEALACCADDLVSFGGHAMAAGLKVHRDRFGSFAEAFQACARERIRAEDLARALYLDAEAELGLVQPALVAEINKLAPFGMGNPRPKFASSWLRLAGEPRVVGRNQDHMQMSVTDGRTTCKAVGFGKAHLLPALQRRGQFRVAFEPIGNEWNGRTSAEMKILDVQLAE